MIYLINFLGLGLIAFIIWWFWLAKSKNSVAVSHETTIKIQVENGIYQPAEIQVDQHKLLNLIFIRKDASDCADTVIFPELAISTELALNQPVTLHIPTLKAGEFEFRCAMGMYRGKLKINQKNT